MRVKVSKSRKLTVRVALVGAGFITFGLAGSVLLTSGLFGGYAMAQVTGPCVNCHTMHNSQNANAMVHAGAGAAWNGGVLTGGGSGQRDNLLVSDCLGCHTATGTTTIITPPGGDSYPIVYSLGGYPTGLQGTSTHPLAGGNFALNAGGANIYGHNVYGISNPDTISSAPGYPSGCIASCHETLARADTDLSNADFIQDGVTVGKINGCRGCHVRLGHHKAVDKSYRYLGGHGGIGMDVVWGDTLGTGGGTTFKDADWEQSKTGTDHNFYMKGDPTDVFIMNSMGRFCAGCHGEFHSMGVVDGSLPMFVDNGGDDNTDDLISRSSGTNPWLRHPTNVNIPFSTIGGGEYAVLLGTAYNPDIPVAQDPTGNKDAIGVGDQVMCLSCHRAHASQYADALRFDYAQMIAHNAGTAARDTGCFYCHRSKDT